MRVCTECLEEKNVEDFSRLWGKQSHLRRRKCRTCMRKYYQGRPKRSNPEYQRKYRIEHKEELAARESLWRKSNPDKRVIQQQKRRAVIAGATIHPVPNDILILMKKLYGTRCMYPECPNINVTLDHIIPLSVGGGHSIDNFQLLCTHHNTSKGNRDSIDYRPEGARLCLS